MSSIIELMCYHLLHFFDSQSRTEHGIPEILPRPIVWSVSTTSLNVFWFAPNPAVFGSASTSYTVQCEGNGKVSTTVRTQLKKHLLYMYWEVWTSRDSIHIVVTVGYGYRLHYITDIWGTWGNSSFHRWGDKERKPVVGLSQNQKEADRSCKACVYKEKSSWIDGDFGRVNLWSRLASVSGLSTPWGGWWCKYSCWLSDS